MLDIDIISLLLKEIKFDKISFSTNNKIEPILFLIVTFTLF